MVAASREPAPAPRLSGVAMHVLLAIGPGERHGYAIMHEVRRITGGTVRLGPGAIYTAIKRLLADGLIVETDERPDPALDDQRRRYYRLTALGHAAAAAEVRRLEAIVSSTRPWVLGDRTVSG